MSLLPNASVSSPGNPYFASSAVDSQVYTTDYAGTVTPTVPYDKPISKPLPVGTYLVTVQLFVNNPARTAAAADSLQFYAYSSLTLYELFVSSTYPVGANATTLNLVGNPSLSITLSGLITSSDPTQTLRLYVAYNQGTSSAGYAIAPNNISYVMISPLKGTAGTSSLHVSDGGPPLN